MDGAGNCYTEMELSLHWLSRALRLNRDAVNLIAKEHGYALDFSDIKAAANHPETLFLEHHEHFCSLSSDSEDGKITLHSYGNEIFYYDEMPQSDKARIGKILK